MPSIYARSGISVTRSVVVEDGLLNADANMRSHAAVCEVKRTVSLSDKLVSTTAC